MPLKKVSRSAPRNKRRAVASENIARELRAGKPRKQAIAIGLKSAGLARPKRKRSKK